MTLYQIYLYLPTGEIVQRWDEGPNPQKPIFSTNINHLFLERYCHVAKEAYVVQYEPDREYYFHIRPGLSVSCQPCITMPEWYETSLELTDDWSEIESDDDESVVFW